MKKIIFNLKSFKSQIFLAFSSILILIIVWFSFYGFIDNKIKELNEFSYKTHSISKDFSTNIKNFQAFQLFGYKEDNFYLNKKQSDIDKYIENIAKQKGRVQEIFIESNYLKIDVDSSVKKLSKDLDSLYNNVIFFKEMALVRGVKEYGLVGELREKENLLESDANINKVLLLQLHKQGRDYLLEAEENHINLFGKLSDSILNNVKLDVLTKNLLKSYKKNFYELVKMNADLGFSQNQGLYGKINYLNEFIEDSFLQISNLTKVKVDVLKEKLLYTQIALTVLILIFGFFLSLYISHYFTKDIEALKTDISNFIISDFKEASKLSHRSSSIREVDLVLKNYEVLKQKLIKNISGLEEATLKANRNAEFKAQFLANMSHEIRSPLNGVVGMLSMLKNQSLTKEQLEHVEIAEYSAEHLMGLVNMILDHSKIEAGKMKLKLTPMHLKNEMSHLIGLFDYKAINKGLKLHFEFDDAITNTIIADKLRLHQVLINLLDNAIKFTDSGYIKLEVSLDNENSDCQYIVFKIIDTGIGIETENIERLLNAFEQADLTATRKFGGTGLGLTITNQLIKLMGGSKLNINGQSQQGSVFSFVLPLTTYNKETNKEFEIDIQNVQVEAKTHALIVDDNLINQKVLFKLLEKINVSADVASSGFEAIKMFQEKKYNIIFMDINMPEMDGYETTSKIHELENYKTNPIPIVAVTASAFEEDKIDAIDKGMDDFITKPVMLKKLHSVIYNQLTSKKEVKPTINPHYNKKRRLFKGIQPSNIQSGNK